MKTVQSYWLKYGLEIAIRESKKHVLEQNPGNPDFTPGYIQAMQETLDVLNSSRDVRIVYTTEDSNR